MTGKGQQATHGSDVEYARLIVAARQGQEHVDDAAAGINPQKAEMMMERWAFFGPSLESRKLLFVEDGTDHSFEEEQKLLSFFELMKAMLLAQSLKVNAIRGGLHVLALDIFGAKQVMFVTAELHAAIALFSKIKEAPEQNIKALEDVCGALCQLIKGVAIRPPLVHDKTKEMAISSCTAVELLPGAFSSMRKALLRKEGAFFGPADVLPPTLSKYLDDLVDFLPSCSSAVVFPLLNMLPLLPLTKLHCRVLQKNVTLYLDKRGISSDDSAGMCKHILSLMEAFPFPSSCPNNHLTKQETIPEKCCASRWLSLLIKSVTRVKSVALPNALYLAETSLAQAPFLCGCLLHAFSHSLVADNSLNEQQPNTARTSPMPRGDHSEAWLDCTGLCLLILIAQAQPSKRRIVFSIIDLHLKRALADPCGSKQEVMQLLSQLVKLSGMGERVESIYALALHWLQHEGDQGRILGVWAAHGLLLGMFAEPQFSEFRSWILSSLLSGMCEEGTFRITTKIRLCSVLSAIIRAFPSLVLPHTVQIQSTLSNVAVLPAPVGIALVSASLPLVRFSASFLNHALVLLRKLYLARETLIRQLAVYGSCRLLEETAGLPIEAGPGEGLLNNRETAPLSPRVATQCDIAGMLRHAFSLPLQARVFFYHHLIRAVRLLNRASPPLTLGPGNVFQGNVSEQMRVMLCASLADRWDRLIGTRQCPESQGRVEIESCFEISKDRSRLRECLTELTCLTMHLVSRKNSVTTLNQEYSSTIGSCLKHFRGFWRQITSPETLSSMLSSQSTVSTQLRAVAIAPVLLMLSSSFLDSASTSSKPSKEEPFVSPTVVPTAPEWFTSSLVGQTSELPILECLNTPFQPPQPPQPSQATAPASPKQASAIAKRLSIAVALFELHSLFCKIGQGSAREHDVLGGAAMLPLRHILELLELQAKSLESARKSSPAASSEGREDSEAGSGSNGEESATGAAVPVVLLSIGAVNHALRQLSAHMQTADFFPVVLSRDRKMRIITLLLRLFDATHPLPWERPTQAKGTRSSSRLKSRHLAEQSQTANSSSRLCDLALNPKIPFYSLATTCQSEPLLELFIERLDLGASFARLPDLKEEDLSELRVLVLDSLSTFIEKFQTSPPEATSSQKCTCSSNLPSWFHVSAVERSDTSMHDPNDPLMAAWHLPAFARQIFCTLSRSVKTGIDWSCCYLGACQLLCLYFGCHFRREVDKALPVPLVTAYMRILKATAQCPAWGTNKQPPRDELDRHVQHSAPSLSIVGHNIQSNSSDMLPSLLYETLCAFRIDLVQIVKVVLRNIFDRSSILTGLRIARDVLSQCLLDFTQEDLEVKKYGKEQVDYSFDWQKHASASLKFASPSMRSHYASLDAASPSPAPEVALPTGPERFEDLELKLRYKEPTRAAAIHESLSKLVAEVQRQAANAASATTRVKSTPLTPPPALAPVDLPGVPASRFSLTALLRNSFCEAVQLKNLSLIHFELVKMVTRPDLLWPSASNNFFVCSQRVVVLLEKTLLRFEVDHRLYEDYCVFRPSKKSKKKELSGGEEHTAKKRILVSPPPPSSLSSMFSSPTAALREPHTALATPPAAISRQPNSSSKGSSADDFRGVYCGRLRSLLQDCTDTASAASVFEFLGTLLASLPSLVAWITGNKRVLGSHAPQLQLRSSNLIASIERMVGYLQVESRLEKQHSDGAGLNKPPASGSKVGLKRKRGSTAPESKVETPKETIVKWEEFCCQTSGEVWVKASLFDLIRALRNTFLESCSKRSGASKTEAKSESSVSSLPPTGSARRLPRNQMHSRLRSRNAWIDENLVTQGGGDSFADLEDFVVS